jgi:hypothetical protein
LWNGLAGALGTPVIARLDNPPGTGVWHLEQNTPNMGPIPIAVYANGAMSVWLHAGALLTLGFFGR